MSTTKNAAARSPDEDLPAWAHDILRTLPPIMRRPEAAKALGITTRTLDKRLRAGRIAVIEEGRRILIARRAVVDYLVASAGGA